MKSRYALLLPVLLPLQLAAQGSLCDSLSAGFDAFTSGLGVNFQNVPAPAGTQYLWDFGDATSGYGANPFHTYPASGSYYACVTVWWWIPGTMDTCWADHCELVTVAGGGGGLCDSLFNVEFTYTITGTTVHFDGIASLTPEDWYWTFGDGDTGSGNDPTHTYSSSGTYLACVTAWALIPGTTDTCWADYCEWITVGGGGSLCDSLLEASFGWTAAGNVVTFDDMSYSALGTVSYHWTFGDGAASTLANPIHTYADSGAYWVCLVIWATIGGTSDTCWSEECDTVFVGGPNSIWDGDAPPTVQAWPTPFTDHLFLTGIGLHGDLEIRLLDIAGRLMNTRRERAGGTLHLRYPGLPAGQYVLGVLGASSSHRLRVYKE